MATLTDRLKRFVVQELACYASPSAVRDALDARGVSVGLDQVTYYDPTTRAQKRPAKKWVELFHATRADYLADEIAVAIANKRWRLEQLQAIYEKANSPRAKLDALERAAKEAGGAYSNTHKLRHTGKDDDTPIQSESSQVVVLPDNGRGDRPAGALSAGGTPSLGG